MDSAVSAPSLEEGICRTVVRLMLVRNLFQILGGEMRVLGNKIFECLFSRASEWVPCLYCRKISMRKFGRVLSGDLLALHVICGIALPTLFLLAFIASVAPKQQLVATFVLQMQMPNRQMLVGY